METLETLQTVLLILLLLDAIALGGLVLIQQGKGADVGAAFGAGSSNTVFGSAGSASFLTKMTVWLAIGFFVISFGLAYTAKERANSMRDGVVPGFEAPTLDEFEDPLDLPPSEPDSDSDLPDV